MCSLYGEWNQIDLRYASFEAIDRTVGNFNSDHKYTMAVYTV
jgi:hypothetical protein